MVQGWIYSTTEPIAVVVPERVVAKRTAFFSRMAGIASPRVVPKKGCVVVSNVVRALSSCVAVLVSEPNT